MAKRTERWIELTSTQPVGHLKERGPVVRVRGGRRVRYLQDGQWLPTWLVWLRRRRFGLMLALLVLAGAVAAARLLLAER